MECKALLIDIAGKQRFIFNSNKLKLNIGASYIMVNEVFGTILGECIDEFNKEPVFESLNKEWKKTPSKITEGNEKISIGYIGGGNALLLFNKNMEVKDFVKIYSLKLLQKVEGLMPVFAWIDDFDTNNLVKSRKKLNEVLNKNKAFNFTNTTPFKHGIEDDCVYTGNSQTEKLVVNKKVSYISKEAALKFESADASHYLIENELYEDKKHEKFSFSNEIEYLSPEETKRYVAVVHIDGNGMGKKFMAQESLKSLRELSVAVTNKLDTSLKELTAQIVDLFEIKKETCCLKTDENFRLKLDEENNKFILPIRPIINAGDDITFVCHGKLGVLIAEMYMKILDDETVGGKSIKTSAGIAIFHNKYPFYRMYELSNELADDTKDKIRPPIGEEPKGSSLQFLISSEGKIDKLKKIKDNMHGTLQGPYEINFTLQELKSKSKRLMDIPVNVRARHREMIFATSNEQKFWKMHLLNRGYINSVEDPFKEFTYDAIELIDFYPNNLL